jgi:radical SAM protein with 4Fe4S-binding SPASM domain
MRLLREITVEVTQKCNSLCLFCSSLSNSNCESQIPIEKLFEISEFSRQKGATSINISGGEPLLRDDLSKLVTFNENIGLDTVIYTSGNIETYKPFQKIIDGLKNKNRIKFIFNYPSIDRNIFQKLINSTNFEPSTIDNYVSYLLSEGIEVETHIVPNALNVDSLYSTIKHLKSIGVKKVSLLRLVLQGRAEINKNILINDNFNEKFALTINKINKELISNDFQIRLGIPFNNFKKGDCECFAGINKLIFRYDGVVFPCEAFKEAPGREEFILGDIYKNTLESIWINHPIHNRLAILKSVALRSEETCPAQLLYVKN